MDQAGWETARVEVQGSPRSRALLNLWPAVPLTSRDLGLDEILPRIIVRHLLQAPDVPIGEVVQRSGHYVYTGPHVCGPACPGDKACMTGLMAEAAAERLSRGALGIESVFIQPRDVCEVVLTPLVPGGGGR